LTFPPAPAKDPTLVALAVGEPDNKFNTPPSPTTDAPIPVPAVILRLPPTPSVDAVPAKIDRTFPLLVPVAFATDIILSTPVAKG
jgi:hypothetical protein